MQLFFCVWDINEFVIKRRKEFELGCNLPYLISETVAFNSVKVFVLY
jgi:hypothetical protein